LTVTEGRQNEEKKPGTEDGSSDDQKRKDTRHKCRGMTEKGKQGNRGVRDQGAGYTEEKGTTNEDPPNGKTCPRGGDEPLKERREEK